MHPIARIVLGLAAGLVTVFLIDRFLWPGTMREGAIGVVTAVVVLALLGQRGRAA
jgi:uncharacterized membrane protein YeaQ/YmgE (transglycosylase-associated protein family)